MTVVLLHSMYGLRAAVLDAAARIRATTGHEVVVPDLYDGRTADDAETGMKIKDEIGPEELARRAAAAAAPYAEESTVYAGFSLGASLAQRLALGGGARGLLLMHGTAEVPEGTAVPGLPVQLHVADPDEWEPADWLGEWQEGMRRAGARAELFRYPGAGHLFTDPDLADHDEPSARTAWERALAFLQGL
ncbi:dienelactone hydrolase family protein [Actinoallomurus iriomotensis]|uniref:Dienelactone hydrolase n=1 Tax=Actinoallomurus iriomotensis TaxID=478107 RepID=A0A9W6SB24_9ACTN|nr:dienelactone hydrolase family protein [Actinoallomurus iriomotensis]GLY91676.1 dienelactone hydrolase [Actinoallomurus iriomotensis]